MWSPVPCGRPRTRAGLWSHAHARKACVRLFRHGTTARLSSLVRALHAGSAPTTPEAKRTKPNTRAVPNKLKTAICVRAISISIFHIYTTSEDARGRASGGLPCRAGSAVEVERYLDIHPRNHGQLARTGGFLA